MQLPEPIIAIFIQFQPLFSAPSYRKMLWLVCGTLLARGNRTVTAALKMLGLDQDSNWSKYHHLLNRSKWSGLKASILLVRLLVTTFIPHDAPLELVVDETLERRWGKRIKKRGHWRDSLASSHNQNVTTSGLRWVVVALNVKLAWARRSWALPFLSILLTTPKVSQELELRHRTYIDRTLQAVKCLARAFPGRTIKLIGDGAYSVLELGLQSKKLNVTLIAPLRLDARLFASAPERTKVERGRPRLVGARLPILSKLVTDLSRAWQLVELDWYGGATKSMWILTGTAVWYSNSTRCSAPLPIRWVLVRDPTQRLPTRAFFSTDLTQSPTAIVSDFVKRWNIEVTFEESRRHLGVETQRQWNDLPLNALHQCYWVCSV